MTDLRGVFSRTTQLAEAREYLAAAAAEEGIQRVRAAGFSAWQVTDAQRVLDAGCGNGEVADDLAALLPDAEVVGADHAPEAIADAVRRHPDSRVDYRVADIYELPFGDGYFDGVRTERVLQHLAEPDLAVSELARVLRPGGRMLLIDTDWESLHVDGSSAFFREQAPGIYGRVMSTINKNGNLTMGRTLRRRMVQAGFSDVSVVAVPLVFDNLAAAQNVVPMHRQFMTQILDGDDGAGLAGPWFDAMEESAADGTFLATLTIWAATGTR